MSSFDRFVRLVEKFIVDKWAIIILVLAIIMIPAAVVLVFHQSLISLFTALAAVPNIIYSLVKNVRQKILFKKSGQSVTVNKGPKVLVWILDGCNVPAFLEVAQKNDDLRTMFESGYFAQCSTIFPSITPAAHATLMTGCYPKRTRIPAFDWVEVEENNCGKESREYVRVMPDFKRVQKGLTSSKYRKEFFADLGSAFELNQRFLSPFVETLFETMKEGRYSESIKEWVHRGADNFIETSINDVLEDLTKKNLIERESMLDLLMASYKEASNEYGDMIWGSAGSKQLADLMVYWKTGTDTMSHEHGPHSCEVKDEIEEAIGKLTDTIRFYRMHSNQPLYVVITADHSQSEVTRFSYLIEEFGQIFKDRYKVAGRDDISNPEAVNAADIVLANNDRAVMFYLFTSSTPKLQVRDEIIGYLRTRKDVDLIFYLDATIHVIQIRDDGTFAESDDIDRFFAGKDNEYPNGAERVRGLLDGDRWGDIAISLREGYSLNPNFRPEQKDEAMLHGDHGGLNYNDSVVPLLMWGPKIRANSKQGPWSMFRTVDIAPTIAAIFGEQQKVADGSPLHEMWEGTEQEGKK